jgi:hypothetical protein
MNLVVRLAQIRERFRPSRERKVFSIYLYTHTHTYIYIYIYIYLYNSNLNSNSDLNSTQIKSK